jgi:hypothetical protein
VSTIVCSKERDALTRATDRQCITHDFSGIASDSPQKPFEIGPQMSIAPSGWKMACDFQAAKAREAAGSLLAACIRIVAEALMRETPPLGQVVSYAGSRGSDLSSYRIPSYNA